MTSDLDATYSPHRCVAILLAVVLSGCQQTFLFIAPHLCQSIPYLIRARLEIGLDVFGFFFQQNLLSGSFFCGRQILLANIDLDLPLLLLAVVLPASQLRGLR